MQFLVKSILLVVVGYQNDVAIVAGRHRALGVLDGASVRPDLNGAEEGGGPGGAISHVCLVLCLLHHSILASFHTLPLKLSNTLLLCSSAIKYFKL